MALPIATWHTQQPDITSISLAQGKQLTTIGRDGSLKVWSIQSSNELIQQTCNWVRNYLNHNTNQSLRNLCNNVKP